MAKKFLFTLVLTVFAVGLISAEYEYEPVTFTMPSLNITWSVGAGAYFISDFGGGVRGRVDDVNISVEMPHFGGGGFIFLDATFVKASLGFFWTGGNTTTGFLGAGGNITGIGDGGNVTIRGLDFGLFLKYPFVINEQFTVFPLLGINYRAVFTFSIGEQSLNRCARDLSALWLKAGGGMDFPLTGRLFLRGQALYGIRFRNTLERTIVNQTPPEGHVNARFGHGLTLKLSVGIRDLNIPTAQSGEL